MRRVEGEPYVFDFIRDRGFWGHHIDVSKFDRETGTIGGSGHIGGMISPMVQVGDILKIKGSNKGFIMTFEFTRVEYKMDPSDMFFFDAKFISEEDPNG